MNNIHQQYSDSAGSPSTSLDAADTRLVQLLVHDARTPNVELAAAAGIAPSTCLNRVRSLRERGVILGYHAEIDNEALGLRVEAFVMVQLRSGDRSHIRDLTQRLAQLPGVLNVYFMAGANDFQLHVACASTSALSDFVLDNVSSMPDVALTETHLIFKHVSGRPVPSREVS